MRCKVQERVADEDERGNGKEFPIAITSGSCVGRSKLWRLDSQGTKSGSGRGV